MRQRFTYIGLGKLGLPCAEVLAQRYEVVGYDIEPRPTTRVRIATGVREAMHGSELIFVVVPTPHLPEYDGSQPAGDLPPRDFDYSTLKKVLSEVAVHLGRDQRVVVVSTVLPGTCRRELAPLLPPDRLIYSPSFVAMGTVDHDFRNPDLLVIGTQDGNTIAAAPLIDVYRAIVNQQRFRFGTWEEAEAIKIFYNTFITLKLTFVNMIQDVAQRIGHLDVDRVTEALGDARGRILSSSYWRAGMGDGGPCHPRDNIALRRLGEQLELGYDLFSAILACREGQAENLAKHLVSYGRPVAILGKTYKPGVPYIDGSSSVLVGHFVRRHGKLAGFIDPLMGEDVTDTSPLTYLLAHDDPTLHRHRFIPGSVVVDPWRRCPALRDCQVVHYGRPPVTPDDRAGGNDRGRPRE